ADDDDGELYQLSDDVGSHRRETGAAAEQREARRSAVGSASLLLARLHDEHAVDLVTRRLVLDTVTDAPHAAQAPFEQIGGVAVDELLRLGVDLEPPLLVEGGAALDDEVVELLVAVVAVGLAARHHVEEDGIGVEDRVVAPRPLEDRFRLAVAHEIRHGTNVAEITLPRPD